ncbi:MAG: amidase [Gemmatimonadota bacterium]|nr:amidase [Gemmatimonadota bacterium]MDH5760324.1 amidase [Gemmatimonadota bacterium]
MTHDEYLALDGMAMADLIRRGETTSRELVDLALARIERLNPEVNAVVHLMDEEARAAATTASPDSPFAGVPFLLKDLMSEAAGHPITSGSRLLRDYVPAADTELVARYRRAGMIPVGKTNAPEFGLTPFTEPALFGPCRNPWDTSRTPGGSSGGSASAVASGMVPLAGGGDGGGSIRIPASCCGLFGLKPTRGRVPTGPRQGQVWRGAVVEHVLTRSVRDSAAMLDATQGADPGAPYEIAPPARPYLEECAQDPTPLRVAVSTAPMLGSAVSRDAVAAVEEAARLLEQLGHTVVEAAPPVEREAFARGFLTVVACELGSDIHDAEAALGRRARRRDVEPTAWALHLLSGAISAVEYADALRYLERASRRIGAFFQDFDLLLTPTLSTPPARIGELAPTPREDRLLRTLGALGSGRLFKAARLLDEVAGNAFEFTPWTPVFNITGQPAMSLPLHWNAEGLPIGVHFVGHFGREDVLFRLAGQLEGARPWFDRLPELARRPAG